MIVVGAGLAGLAVAARLVSAGREVLLLDGAKRAGGQIHTIREDGLVIELGAEGFVARGRAVPALCELLGIQSSLVEQLTTDTYAVEPSGLVLLPPGEAARRLGFQVPTEELGRGIRSLAAGMGELIDALVRYIGVERLRLSAPVAALHSGTDGVELRFTDGGVERAGAVVLAAPAPVAAALVSRLSPAASAELGHARSMSNVSVNLLYGAGQFRDYPRGSGLIFPESFAALGLRALSLVDHKFAGRCRSDQALLRVFFRPNAAQTAWDDARFASEAARAITSVLDVSGEPLRVWVSRWNDALPVFSPEYRESAAAADSALQALGVHLAGSAFHGAGIDAAVASAERVALRLSS